METLKNVLEFQNMLSFVLMTTALLLTLSCFSDLYNYLRDYFTGFFRKIILSKPAFLIYQFVVSALTLVYDAKNFSYLSIFDEYAPCFLAILVYLIVLSDKYLHGSDSDELVIHVIVWLFWIMASQIHLNWFLGVMVVIMTFYIFGFRTWSFERGYVIGFSSENSLQKSLALAIILNGLMIACVDFKLFPVWGSRFMVYQIGVRIWATMIGSVAVLILGQEYGIWVSPIWNFMLMSVGNLLRIASYMSIGNTFMIMWLLDLQRQFVFRENLTINLFLIFLNVYALKWVVVNYPERFVFG